MQPSDLLAINVNEHTEKKNGLTYLSWAWGWDQCLRIDPNAQWEVKTFEDKLYNQKPYMEVNGTALVWVTVTLLGTARTCMLPVMDYRNKPIANPDAFAVNTAIMRCLVKAIALHGLGLYIYAGEDLPTDIPVEDKPEPKIEGVTPEATAQVARIVETAVISVVDGVAPDSALMTVFRDGAIEYAKLQKSKEALSNYWKSNQETIDKMKKDQPEMFKSFRDKFSEIKATLPSDPTFNDKVFDQKVVSDKLMRKVTK